MPNKHSIESRWTVLRKFSEPRAKTGNSTATTRTWCIARCRCGIEKKVDFGNVTSGRSISCGCHRRELFSRNGKSGVWENKSFKAWKNMLDRCNNRRCKGYENYGGRGIYVCPRWCARDVGYEVFLADMGEPPSKNHSIGRKDNDGPYCPSNCRWETRKQQDRNKQTTKYLTVDGVTNTLCGWADMIGVTPQVIRARLRIGWPVELAATAPLGTKFRRP